MELFRLPSVHKIFLRASVYKASPGARFARATGRRITYYEIFAFLFVHTVHRRVIVSKYSCTAGDFLPNYYMEF